MATSLNHAREELKKSDEFKKDVRADISYDLRTRLMVIKVYAEMLQDRSCEIPET